MKRASYRDAIYFLAWNDDTEWLTDPRNFVGGYPCVSVSASLVIDLFDIDERKLISDLRRALEAREADLKPKGRNQ